MSAETLDPTTWPTALDLRAAANESVGATGDNRGQPELFEDIGSAINRFEQVANSHASDIDTLTAELGTATDGVADLRLPTYLVGVGDGALSAEIVVGATPGGELAGGSSTWAVPKITTAHAGGQSHAQVQAAAEATAAAALAAHAGLTTDAHDASAISVLDTAGILLAANVEAALAELRQGVINRLIVDVREIGVLSSNTAAVNSFNFNINANAAPYVGRAVDWLFTEDTYDTQNFNITQSNHRMIGKAKGGVNLNYKGAGGTHPCISITGSAAGGGYGTRVQDVLIEGFTLNNVSTGAPEDSLAFRFRHWTHCAVSRCYVFGFRGDGGGLDSSNGADSIFAEVDWQFCASKDDSDKPVIKFHNDDDNSLWNNDSMVFFKCNFEQNGDRLVDCRQGNGAGSGLQCDKITFLCCKHESSDSLGYNMGGSAGDGAAIYIDNCGSMSWIMCDFTLQNMRTSHAIIPTIFHLEGTADIHLTSTTFHIGSGSSPKCFTNFIVATDESQLVSLTDVWVDSGNTSAFPTQVLDASTSANPPGLAMSNVGFTRFKGTGKVATDWFTAADWDGVHAGAAAGGGIIA